MEQVNSYTIYRKRSGEESYTEIASNLRRSTTRFIDVNVEVGETYHYKVVAINDQGRSEVDAASLVRVTEEVELFSEMFSGGSFDNQWRTLGAFSFIEDGVNLKAVFPRATGSLAVREVFPAHYRIEIVLRVKEWGNLQFSLLRLAANMDGNITYHVNYWPSDRRFELVKRGEGKTMSVAEAQIALVPGQWHRLRFEAKSGFLELYLDDQLLLSWDDPQPLTGQDLELFVSNIDLEIASIKVVQ